MIVLLYSILKQSKSCLLYTSNITDLKNINKQFIKIPENQNIEVRKEPRTDALTILDITKLDTSLVTELKEKEES